MTTNRKLAGVGLAAGLLAGGAAGFVLQSSGSASAGPSVVAVTDSTTPAAPPAASTDPSAPLPVSAEDRQAARVARITEVLKALVDDGTLTQAQADKVAETLAASMPDRGPGGPGGRGGRGHRGPGGPGHRGFQNLEVAAGAIGITVDELRTEVIAGKTIAQVAEANGKTAQNVIDALVAEAKTMLDARVTDGTITQADADTRLTEITTRITDGVYSTRPAFNQPDHHDDDDAPVGSTEATTDTTTG